MGENVEFDEHAITPEVKYIMDGYIDYAESVITGRALPDLRDGLKTVNRRILFSMHESGKKGALLKSAKVVGDTMSKYHPHGDSSIYDAAVLMVDSNGTLAFPLINGQGSFGKVYSGARAAAMRYTEMRLHSNTEELFGELNGVKMIPNFNDTAVEPEVLPATFPMVLVNSTSGIAVGFRTNIPSFNITDVCELVKEYIKDGKCHTMIAPDFTTGGYYIKDNQELARLMKYGRARLKLRGKLDVAGKEINALSVPYGKTIQGILNQIKNKDPDCIRTAYSSSDFGSGLMFTVDCKSKNRVDEAIYTLYKDTDFQYMYSADITVVEEGRPMRLGVWDLIEHWVQWRRGVLKKDLQVKLDSAKAEAREAIAFMTLVRNREKCCEFTAIVVRDGRTKGKEYLRANFTRDEIPEDLIDFVAERSLPSYNDGGKYAKIATTSDYAIKTIESNINNVDSLITMDMNRIIHKYAKSMPRRTEVIEDDFSLEEHAEEEDRKKIAKSVDTTGCVYELRDNFLKKVRRSSGDRRTEYSVNGLASDYLLMFDNRGRILRCNCADVEFHANTDMGLYLPKYFGLDEPKDYKITWMGRMDGSTLMLLYRDGNVGFVDETEWQGVTRQQKVIQNGISVECADKLGYVFNITQDETLMDKYLYVMDKVGCIGYYPIKDIKRKGRTAKTRVFKQYHGEELDSFALVDGMAHLTYLLRINSYGSTMKPLDLVDFNGNEKDFKPLRGVK